jgi:hypothetical protein
MTLGNPLVDGHGHDGTEIQIDAWADTEHMQENIYIEVCCHRARKHPPPDHQPKSPLRIRSPHTLHLLSPHSLSPGWLWYPFILPYLVSLPVHLWSGSGDRGMEKNSRSFLLSSYQVGS